jgi:hypothetical protein
MKLNYLSSLLLVFWGAGLSSTMILHASAFQEQRNLARLTHLKPVQDDKQDQQDLQNKQDPPRKFDEMNLDRPWNWSTHSPTDAGVQFKMPDKPRLSERMFKPAEDQPPIRVRNYIGSYRQGKMVFVVNYHDLPVTPSEESIDLILQSALVGSVANLNGKILKTDKIRYGENPGREFQFRFANQETIFLGIGRVFMVGQRQYMLSLMMPEEDYSDWLAKEFLNSFRLVEGDSRNPGLGILTVN